MENTRAGRTWTLIGAAVLALTVGIMARQTTRQTDFSSEPMRDAVAAPISPAMLGGVRVVQPNAGYFASPAGRRAEAERVMMASRLDKVSKAMYARAAKLRRERASAVTAQ